MAYIFYYNLKYFQMSPEFYAPLYILIFYTFQLPKKWAEHHHMVKHALSNPSRKVWEGLFAAQKEFLEHANPSNIDDLAKFVLLNEKELGSKVADMGENIEKSIHHDILSHLGNEAILPEDTAKKRHTRGNYYFFYHIFY